MSSSLLVVGNKSETKIFLARKDQKHLELMELVKNNKGRKKEGELTSDRAGESVRNSGGSTHKGAMTKEVSAHEHAVEKYVSGVVNKIFHLHNENAKLKIMLVAEPGFQGILKKSLDRKKLEVFKSINKELVHISDDDIYKTLAEEISLACFV